MPKISVIVPVYKVEKYLDKCVQSILNQTFTDFELILVDDGSPDNCPKMCDEYAKKDSRIKVIHKPNGGLSDARNAGLDIAIGDYIYFCDSDDYIDENLLEKTYNCAVSNNADAVRFGLQVILDDVYQKPFNYCESQLFDLSTSTLKLEYISKIYLKYKVGYEACGCLFKADVITKNNLRFVDTKKIFAEDLLFSLCFITCASNIFFLKENLYYYIRREDSLTGKFNAIIKVNEINNLSKYFYENFAKKDAILTNHYSIIHFLIVYPQLKKLPPITKHKDVLILNQWLNAIQEKAFFDFFLKVFYKNKKCLKFYASKKIFDRWYIKTLLKYYVNMNYNSFAIEWCICKALSLPLRILGKLKNKPHAKN